MFKSAIDAILLVSRKLEFKSHGAYNNISRLYYIVSIKPILLDELYVFQKLNIIIRPLVRIFDSIDS